MEFKVQKDELIRNLEIIIETQGDDTQGDDTQEGVNDWANTSGCVGTGDVKQIASDMLLTVLRNPLECATVMLSEQDAMFIAEYL